MLLDCLRNSWRLFSCCLVVLRFYLAAIMAAMGVLQLAGWPAFLEAVEGYRVPGGWPVAVGLAALLISGELAAAVGLLRDRRIGAVLSLAVMAVWTIMAAQAFARGLALDNCGCFGRLWRQELRWWVLLEDAYLLALSWWALRRYRTDDPVEATPVPVRT